MASSTLSSAPRTFGTSSEVALSELPRARAARHIRQFILDGVYAPGEPLPAERTLSEQLQVNRGTLRSALEMLSEEGLLRSNGGRMRLVVGPQNKRTGLMQNVIAVLMPFEPPSNTSSALNKWWWQNSIGAYALNTVQSFGLHAMALHPPQLLGEEIEHLLADRPRGVLITDMMSQWSQTIALYERLQNEDIPVVVYGGSPGLDGHDRVTSDHAHGAYELTKVLLAQGRRRILNLWPAPADQYWFAQRRAGYERALQEAGIEALPSALMPPFNLSLGDKENFDMQVRFLAGHLVEHLTGENSIDAMMLSTDRDTFAAAAACRLFGKTPNEDVAIVGYDNYWMRCEERELESTIPLATMDKRHDLLGAEMVSLLQERIAGEAETGAQCRVIAPELVVTH
jgi:DNA-binding LacI/PurR family transcriptional regulator